MKEPNVQNEGDWLRFRMPASDGNIRVFISHEAMQNHFGATHEPDGIHKAYTRRYQDILAAVRARITPGAVYTAHSPLKLREGDF